MMRNGLIDAHHRDGAELLLGPGLIGPGKLLLPSQVEERFALTRKELAYLRRRGKGPRAVRFGRFYLYPPAAIIEWLNATRVSAAEAMEARS
ncbi:hypothetical protein [Sphingomonas crocodyli]|uniref:DNA-binding protein n=1 Tax=Sphingomonas crocodyli TaxID=1979270 RepID=A0A437M765_9SPHN|nr:hypothetical protein [Sphingomonas crocodyli]RVT93433.1 hypothetical protein EOD43_06030 [Sphingomonas crocodyli]